ncbi:hypothetical protein NLG97_g4883 [Lecanicillium saksenae]|uniref:Uncharacterized protein n=1 Tax=Lecanicillium saksenae TaxID=468837 RepID=A0ACC1QXA1_9HYPO|nr:hypothetical protein NLG97_g4883 [Lecanicillium saksenae]
MLAPLTAVLALASTASAAAIDACGAPAPPKSSCSSYTIINARGTSEPQGESVGFYTMNKNVLAQRSGGKIYNVVYPASWDQNSEPGTKDLLDEVSKLLAKDASECIILEGYSQGATVVVDALRSITGPAFDAVKGVFLIGDTRHEPGLACNVDMQGGDKTKDTEGLLYIEGKGIPDNWVSKSLDVCNVGDSVCDRSAVHGNTTITQEHLAYPGDNGLQNMGASFILKQLVDLGEPPPPPKKASIQNQSTTMTLAEFTLQFHNWRHGVAKHKAATRKTDAPLRAGALSAASINWIAFFDPVGSHADVALRAVAARSLAKAQAQIDACDLGKDVKAYGSYEELVADPDIDIIYIGLINCYHVEWVIKCMEGGKHVLLEKPAVTNAAEFDLLKACSARTGKVVLEAMHWRFHPAAHTVKSLIDSGKYGAVQSVNSRLTLHSGIFTPDDPRFKYEYAGGASMDLIYVVSSAAYFAGLTPESTASVQKAVPRLSTADALVDEAMVTELSIQASEASSRAVSCSLHCDLMQPKLLRLVPKMWESVPVCTVELEKAQIHFENFVGPHLNHSIVIRAKNDKGKLSGKKETVSCYQGGSVWGETGERWWTSYRYQLEAFVRVVREVDGGKIDAAEAFQPWLSLDDSKAVMAVVDAIYSKAGLPLRKSAPQKE